MALNSSFQLSLELASVFPIGAILKSIGSNIWSLALGLRKSGSDLVVEVELAQIFGRGQISEELEKSFRDAVKLGDVVPLQSNSTICLDSSPGPSMRNALSNSYFFATVVQLSLLGWIHNRDDFASLLAKCMRARVEAKMPDASIDPGVEGIAATMAACNSQSSGFDWSVYVEAVETRLKSVLSDYQHSPDYLKLPRSLLLAAMDYLYLVQRLPDDRKMTVSNQMGSVTLIIWAYYVLGLTVALK